jgi:LPS-assembly protein
MFAPAFYFKFGRFSRNNPIAYMLRRLILLFILISYAVYGMANTSTSGWNCTQTTDDEEWLCVTEPGATATPATPGVPAVAKDTQNQTVSKPASPIPVPSFGPYVSAGSEVSTSPPRTVDQQGWSCKAEDGEEKWACHLSGPDPKGLARIVVSDDQERFGHTAFDVYQEQVFKMMQADYDIDPWANCASPRIRNAEFLPDMDLREQAPLDVKADYSEIFDKEITTFTGNVEMTRADQFVTVDRTTYDAISQTMDAQGNVYYRESGLSIFSDTALIRLADDQARMREALFMLPAGRGRGSADVVYRDSSDLSRFKNVVYTTCKPGNQDWAVHASRLKINQESGKASVKHAWLEFKGIPFLYSPYLSFPIDDRRASGFLSPSFGNNDDNGYDFSLPYYWNIAPNYDATFTPRLLSKRGLLLAGDFRYLSEITEGKVSAEYLPYDGERKETRGQFSWENRANFFPGLSSNIDINYVSDDDFLDELGDTLSITDSRFVRSRADLIYRAKGVRLNTLFESYQTIDNEILDTNKPYRRLPQVTLNLDKSFDLGPMPLDLNLDSQFTYFQRSGGPADPRVSASPGSPFVIDPRISGVTGQRLIVEPSISLPFKTPGGFVIPKVALQHTQYWLQDTIDDLPAEPFIENDPADDDDDVGVKSTVPAQANSFNRTLPIFSLDSGLFFDRDIELAGSPFVQTLEPRLFYLYIPFKNQDGFPDFDTSEFDFNISSLFRDNRFSGGDRLQDANQVSLGMTSRLIDSESGHERLKFDLGQIFYFRDRLVKLPGDTVETGNFSDVLAGLSGQITDTVSFSSLGQWSTDTKEIVRGEAFLRYRGEQQQIFNMGYRFREPDVFRGADATKQSDVSMIWPVYDGWSFIGRWLYSYEENLTLEALFGVEKESCCWRFRVLGRRNIRRSDTEGDADTGIFVQLELKGLTGFGDKVERFLEKNISGYRAPKR